MSVSRTFVLEYPADSVPLEFTGERFTPEVGGAIAHEHLHRYLFALQFCEGKQVLDVASGEGYGTFLLSTVAERVIGVDLSEATVLHARTRYVRRNLRYERASCTALPLDDASVDVVTSFETLEHVSEHEAFLGEIRRVLRPDGLLVISTPDKATYSGPGTEPNPFHVKELSTEEFLRMLRASFAQVVSGVQKAATGSLLVPDESAGAELEWFSTPDGRTFLRTAAVHRPMYRLAVASNAPLPRVRWGALDDDRGAGDLRGMIEVLSSQLRAARADAEAQDVRARQAEAEIAVLRQNLDGIVRSKSWAVTRPLRDLARLGREARGRSLQSLVWESGKAAVRSLPAGPRERVRAWKRRMIGDRVPGEPPDLSVRDLDNPRVSTALKRALADLAADRGPDEPYSHLLVVPFLKSGGADLTAMNYLRFVCEARGPRGCLVVLADAPDLTVRGWIPPGVTVLRLDDYIEAPTARERIDVLHGIVDATGVRVLHNVNSVAGWNLVIHRGAELSRRTRLFGSIFALQFDEKGGLIGYAAEFFARARPNLEGLITDNARFANDVVERFDVDREWAARRIHVVYNPSRGLETPPPAPRPRGPADPLRVLWAGRLDAEKLPDVLQAVSERAPFATFDVFGGTVVDAREAVIRPHERLHLRGAYKDLEAVFASGAYDAFLFTSKWEGMPNVLLEVGAHATPVVAPDVGGVPELVCEDTGWLVRGARNVAGYVDALEAIRRDPAEARRRAENLARLVRERHCWPRFVETLQSIPGYA